MPRWNKKVVPLSNTQRIMAQFELDSMRDLKRSAEAKIIDLETQLGLAHAETEIPARLTPVGRAGQGLGTPEVVSGRKRRRTMSAEARKRIGAAQRKRWAEHHKTLEAAAAPSPKTTGRGKTKKAKVTRASSTEGLRNRKPAKAKTAPAAAVADLSELTE